MKIIFNPFRDCYRNIGSEEYYLSKFEDDVFYLYINSPCVVVGFNQNTHAEINQSYVEENRIDVVRRLSGGGAVFHDFGNLNYGFIVKKQGEDIRDVFQKYTRPIVRILQGFGVDVCFSGRNDLLIGDKKISGVAQYHTNNKVLIHGTLLFDSDMSQLAGALNSNPVKYGDKSVKSVKSRVTNIFPHLQEPLTIDEFANRITSEISAEFPGSYFYEPGPDDREAIQKLADTKYSTWEWNYGRFPHFTYRHLFRYEMGTLDVGVNVVSGKIKDIELHGDFFGTLPVGELREKLRNLPYDFEAVEAALSTVDISEYIFGLTKEMLLRNLFGHTGDENTFV